MMATGIAIRSGQGVATTRTARKRLDCPLTPPHGTSECLMRENMDGRYPLPTEFRPRSVTLSDGTLVSASPIANGPRFYVTWRQPGCGGRTGSLNNPLQLAVTPDDARRLAYLVEHPFEEVAL